MTDDIQTTQMDYAEAMEMLYRQQKTIEALRAENARLTAEIEEWRKVLRKSDNTLDPMRSEIKRLRAHISEMHSVIEWMVALIDGGEEMPKPGDEIHDDLSLCLINTKEFSARAAMGESDG